MLEDPRYRLDPGLDLGWNASRDKIPGIRQVLDPETLILTGLKVTNITHVFSLHRRLGETECLRGIWREISTLLETSPSWAAHGGDEEKGFSPGTWRSLSQVVY
jgi:hypothetical protein